MDKDMPKMKVKNNNGIDYIALFKLGKLANLLANKLYVVKHSIHSDSILFNDIFLLI